MSTALKQTSCILVLVMVLTSLATATFFDAFEYDWSRIDFAPYLAAANRLRDKDPLYVYNKDNLYTAEQYVYPPLPALMVRPFAGSKLNTVTHAWTAIEIVLLAFSVLLFCWAVRLNPLKDLGTVLLLCVATFQNYPTQLQIYVGNIDISILVCLVGVMTAASSFKRWKTAALLISLAASIKTWAIIFTAYLFINRKWKEGMLAIGAFLLSGLAFFSVLGVDQFVTFAKLQKLYSYQPKLNSNSIIPMCRLFSGNPTLEHHKPQMLFPGADTVLPVVGVVASALMIVAFLAVAWRFFKSPEPAKLPLLISFCIMTYLLLTPLSHQYYYVLALPVIWSLIVLADPVRRLGRQIEDDWVGVTMWAGAMVVFLLFVGASPGLIEAHAYYGFGKFAPLGYGTTIVAGLTLWLCTTIGLVVGRSEASAGKEQSLLDQADPDGKLSSEFKRYQTQGVEHFHCQLLEP